VGLRRPHELLLGELREAADLQVGDLGLAAAVRKAPAKAKGLLAQIVFDAAKRYGASGKGAAQYIPLGTTAEDFIRHVAHYILYRELADDHWGCQAFPKRAKAFGIDVKKLLDEHAPAPKAEKPAKASNKKAPRK